MFLYKCGFRTYWVSCYFLSFFVCVNTAFYRIFSFPYGRQVSKEIKSRECFQCAKALIQAHRNVFCSHRTTSNICGRLSKHVAENVFKTLSYDDKKKTREKRESKFMFTLLNIHSNKTYKTRFLFP